MIALSSLHLKSERPARWPNSFSPRIYGTEPPLPQARPYVLGFSHSVSNAYQVAPGMAQAP
jgi:hypothetical protein